MFLPGCDAILDSSIWGHAHRDYKRIEAASGDEPRNKLNKSNGGKFKSRMYANENFKENFFYARNTRSKPMTSLSTNFSTNMAAIKERSSFCSS